MRVDVRILVCRVRGWQDGYRVPREFRFPGAARANVSDCFAALHRSIVGFYTVGRQTGFAGTYLR